MYDHPRILTSICFGAALLGSGCGDGVGDEMGFLTTGIGDVGDETDGMEDNEAGDGDPGDGDPAGDGDPSGDGDPTGDPPECDGTSPYMGGWDIGCCQDEVDPQNGWSPGGVHVGTIMPDWTLTDQFGEALRLYDFCHNAVWFEYVALW
jgi:hypothetical protein